MGMETGFGNGQECARGGHYKKRRGSQGYVAVCLLFTCLFNCQALTHEMLAVSQHALVPLLHHNFHLKYPFSFFSLSTQSSCRLLLEASHDLTPEGRTGL